MKNSLSKNYLYNVVYQIIIVIFPLLTAPYVARVLGAENLGIYSYSISISTYFIMFGSLGVALYGKREVAFVQEDKYKYSKVFWEIFLLRCFTMLVSIVVFYCTYCTHFGYEIYFKVLLFEMIGNIFDISWFYQGLEEFKKTITRNMIVKILSVGSIFLFVKTPQDLIIYFIIYVVSIILGNISLWFYLPKFLKKVDKKKLNIKKHIKPTIALFIPQIAVQVYTILDKAMIGTIISDKSQVGYYDQAEKIIRTALTVVTSLGTVMLPRIASMFAKKNHKQIQLYLYKSFRVVFALGFPMIMGLISVSGDFVPVFYGQGYDEVVILLQLLSPIILFIGLASVVGIEYLLPTKKQREYTTSVLCGAACNVILNLIFIPMFKARGAAIGTIGAEMTVTLTQIWFVRKELDLMFIVKSSLKYVLASIIMFIILNIIAIPGLNHFCTVIMQLIVGIIVYFGVLFVIKDELIIETKEKIGKKLKRTKKA